MRATMGRGSSGLRARRRRPIWDILHHLCRWLYWVAGADGRVHGGRERLGRRDLHVGPPRRDPDPMARHRAGTAAGE